jgi:hypothetical protein
MGEFANPKREPARETSARRAEHSAIWDLNENSSQSGNLAPIVW